MRKSAVETADLISELLAAEVDDRAERRRARRITAARFPRLKRLSQFNVDAVMPIQPAQLATLAHGHYLSTGETGGAPRRQRHREYPPT